MYTYIVRRLIGTVFTLLGVSIIVFMLLHLTGDPVALILPLEATQEEIDLVRKELGLDRPLIVQYFYFITDALRGDFGNSIRGGQPALDLVLDRIPATIQLTFVAMFISLAISIPLGIISAVKRNSLVDYINRVFCVLGIGTPIYWSGMMLILFFSIYLGWLPSSGTGTIWHLVLPATALGLEQVARTSRLMRSSMLEVLGEDYLRTARAKGLNEGVVIRRHALKNAMIPVVTVTALQLGQLLGGAVVTESIFAWPGLGRLVLQAVYARDYPVVQVATLIFAVSFCVINLLADILIAYINPRVRFE